MPKYTRQKCKRDNEEELFGRPDVLLLLCKLNESLVCLQQIILQQTSLTADSFAAKQFNSKIVLQQK